MTQLIIPIVAAATDLVTTIVRLVKSDESNLTDEQVRAEIAKLRESIETLSDRDQAALDAAVPRSTDG